MKRSKEENIGELISHQFLHHGGVIVGITVGITLVIISLTILNTFGVFYVNDVSVISGTNYPNESWKQFHTDDWVCSIRYNETDMINSWCSYRYEDYNCVYEKKRKDEILAYIYCPANETEGCKIDDNLSCENCEVVIHEE